MTHHDPGGSFGFVPYGSMWLARAEESLESAQRLADAAARNIADWVTAGLPMDHFRLTHYRRSKAAEHYAHAVYVERVAAR